MCNNGFSNAGKSALISISTRKSPWGWSRTAHELKPQITVWEAAMLTNAKVMEAQSTDEQAHYSSSGATASSGRNQHGAHHHGGRDRATATDRRHSSLGWTCWHCGSKERHSRKQCPASKPGVVCSHCISSRIAGPGEL